MHIDGRVGGGEILAQKLHCVRGKTQREDELPQRQGDLYERNAEEAFALADAGEATPRHEHWRMSDAKWELNTNVNALSRQNDVEAMAIVGAEKGRTKPAANGTKSPPCG